MTKSPITMKRAPTGVPGLDDVLGGGFPSGHVSLIQGASGTGKTTLGMQFLLEGRRRGERCLYVTLSETPEELGELAASHGWILDGIQIDAARPPGDPGLGEDENTLFFPSEVELEETWRWLLDRLRAFKPQRIVFDSLTEVRLLAQSAVRYRRQVIALKSFLTDAGATALLLEERSGDGSDAGIQSLVRAIIVLEMLSPPYGSERRRFRVIKMRASRYRGGYHDFRIETGGIRVFARLVAAEHRQEFEPGAAPSGVRQLDELVGGGIDRGTTVLLMGPAGSGKSAIAMRYAYESARRSERSTILTFDEGIGTMKARTRGLGMDIDAPEIARFIHVEQIDPAEMSPGEFAQMVRTNVEEQKTRMLVIDGLNGFQAAMPGEQFLTLHLHELFTFLRQRGIVTLVTLGLTGIIGVDSPLDISYLADTVLLFRYFELDGQIRKAVSVVKRRSRHHETTIRELILGPGGITLGDPLTNFRGLLTGIPFPKDGSPQPS